MSEQSNLFIENSRKACLNNKAKNIVSKNLKSYYKTLSYGLEQYENIEEARDKAHYYKFKAIESLDKYITEFETKFTERGGKFLYANDIEQAQKYLLSIISQTNTKNIVKSKSMVYEELSIDKILSTNDINVINTDLGDFLIQLLNQKSSHLTSPALHLSLNDIIDLLNNKYNQNFNEKTPIEELVRFVRQLLRDEFFKADMGISGCNFLLPDIGAIAIAENEANVILGFTYPSVHVVITSIEKFIPGIASLELFQTLLSTYSGNQTISAYNHLLFGPSTSKELNGPSQLYVILVDNNRHKILEKVELREAAYCIKCGACHNHCPVYKQIGGQAYGSVYSGPIGSIISPFIFGENEYHHLPYASTLCGKCNDVCPVKINLTGLLIQKRKQIVNNNYNTLGERYVFNLIFNLMKKRRKMERYPSGIKNIALNFILSKNWGLEKEIPKFTLESFYKIRRQESKRN